MIQSVSTEALSPTSYLVLGLVGGLGPVTPYEMKQFVRMSIGYFWPFPHSQLYAEPDRLVDLGLVAVDQEPDGRRRKRYTITDAGRAAIEEWLGDPSSSVEEIRSLATLKLYFGSQARRHDDIVALARAQAAASEERLAVYRDLTDRLHGAPDMEYPLATLECGIAVEETKARFWRRIAGTATAPAVSAPAAAADE